MKFNLPLLIVCFLLPNIRLGDPVWQIMEFLDHLHIQGCILIAISCMKNRWHNCLNTNDINQLIRYLNSETTMRYNMHAEAE